MPPQQRLFLALQPGPAARQRLQACVPDMYCQGRRVPTGNMHMTLHFLGNCSENQQGAVREVAAGVDVPGGQITLSRLAVWPGPRVQVLEPWSRRAPAWLCKLHNVLGAGLLTEGFQLESRPYRPHLTLARRCPPHDDQRLAPVRLRLRDFVLMISESGPSGVCYRVIGRWPLRKADRHVESSVERGC